MATTILIPEKDPMGAAISDFFNLHRADRLRVFSSQFEEDEIPVKELFRSMPSMRRKRMSRPGTSGYGKRGLCH